MVTDKSTDKSKENQEDAGSTDVEKVVHFMKENESQGDIFSAMQYLKGKNQEDEVEKFLSMTDKVILVLKLVGVLGGLVLINLSYALLKKSKEYPWIEKGKHVKHDDKFAKHKDSEGKKLYNRDATASGRIILLLLTTFIGASLMVWGFGKIFVALYAKNEIQLKTEYIKMGKLMRKGSLSLNIPMFLQAIAMNHVQNLSKTKYFIEMLFTGIVGGLMAIIGQIRFLIEFWYAFLKHTEGLFIPFTFGFKTGATPGCVGKDPPWIKDGLGVYNLYTKDECREGNKKGCVKIPLFYPKDFLSIIMLLFGIFLIIYHAGGVIVWLIIMFGSIIGKIFGKILNSLRCNFNSTCDDEIQDIHTYSKDELNAAKEVEKKNTMKVKNMTNEEYENYIKDTNVKLEEGKQNIDNMKKGLNNEINDMKAQISEKIPFFKSKKMTNPNLPRGTEGMIDANVVNTVSEMSKMSDNALSEMSKMSDNALSGIPKISGTSAIG